MGMWRIYRTAKRTAGKLRKFIALQSEMKLLLVEAYLFLAGGSLLKALPFHRIAPMLGSYMEETPDQPAREDEEVIRQISHAVHLMSRYTFWESECLVKAVAAMCMLHRRQIDSTIYLGIARARRGDLAAHAWLRCGSMIITGGEVMNQYTVVGSFAKRTISSRRS
jgi:hypothetical protein